MVRLKGECETREEKITTDKDRGCLNISTVQTPDTRDSSVEYLLLPTNIITELSEQEQEQGQLELQGSELVYLGLLCK